ncbi:diguanylate cyclase response regulator [Bacterioplanes sanyensis]|uniref:diguanylate cyclase n=1 Tax=Bacterioplanes sanyensis TaxID=1249553 RepID=A0A222FME2_9GAMM|nr:diguanylate cyclase [Bacterioplanes sanyensis]ASP39551.1 diguanylate cyclase response regulator [Bacterioplanes sanyensis]
MGTLNPLSPAASGDEQMTVLLADDSPENIQALAACLHEQFQLKVANNGEQCLELARRFHPDLILLDIEMPGMNGFDVCQQLKDTDATADIPIIFVSGHTSLASEERGLELGAVDYIFKPIRPAIVKARVNTHITLKRQRDRLAQLAMRDQLTGLYNRHYLMEHIGQRLSRCHRHGYQMAALMIDIDHFKRINDELGHQQGDDVLTSLGTFLCSYFRTEDLVARLGGEEFLVVLDPCPDGHMMDKAQQLLHAVEQLNPAGTPITISIGATSVKKDDSLGSLLKRADDALYQAKQQGRNRVCAG